MAGVSLVGYSGSLIKGAAQSTLRLLLSETDPSTSEPVGEPEVTKVLVGKTCCHFIHIGVYNNHTQASSSFSSPKCCKYLVIPYQ